MLEDGIRLVGGYARCGDVVDGADEDVASLVREIGAQDEPAGAERFDGAARERARGRRCRTTCAAEQGFGDLRPRHGAVLAHLDEDGIRLADLARIAGRNKQTIAAIVDELENLGYVSRADDPADRRAKLIVPTERGRQRMRAGDQIIDEIERRHEAKLGRTAYAGFKQALRAITADQAKEREPEQHG